jgi:hypothetical protein
MGRVIALVPPPVRRRALPFVGHLAAGLPRNQPSRRGRADDCMARTTRKSNHLRLPSDGALLLL